TPAVPIGKPALESWVVGVPLIHAHSPIEGWNSQRSLNAPPPKSHRFPLRSTQVVGLTFLAAGTLPGAGVPNVPGTPGWVAVSGPLAQVHWLVEGLNSQRSFSLAAVPAEPNPMPPNSQRFPLPSIQLTTFARAP